MYPEKSYTSFYVHRLSCEPMTSNLLFWIWREFLLHSPEVSCPSPPTYVLTTQAFPIDPATLSSLSNITLTLVGTSSTRPHKSIHCDHYNPACQELSRQHHSPTWDPLSPCKAQHISWYWHPQDLQRLQLFHNTAFLPYTSVALILIGM